MAATPKGRKPEPHKSPTAKPAAPTKAAGKAVPVAIYALADPGTGEIRYIGKANDPRARLKSHIRDSRRRNTPVYCWIRKLQEGGQEPSMAVIEWAVDWVEAEKRHIAAYRAEGARSRNKTVWATNRHLGQLQRYFDKAGSKRCSELVVAIKRLFDLLTHQQQEAVGRRFGGAHGC